MAGYIDRHFLFLTACEGGCGEETVWVRASAVTAIQEVPAHYAPEGIIPWDAQARVLINGQWMCVKEPARIILAKFDTLAQKL